jgi:hypothetical protein
LLGFSIKPGPAELRGFFTPEWYAEFGIVARDSVSTIVDPALPGQDRSLLRLSLEAICDKRRSTIRMSAAPFS